MLIDSNSTISDHAITKREWIFLLSFVIVILLSIFISYTIGFNKGKKSIPQNIIKEKDKITSKIDDNVINTFKHIIEIKELPPDSVAVKLNNYFKYE